MAYSAYPPPPQTDRRTVPAQNGLAVIGFVCAVLGAGLGLIPLLGIVAFPLGIIGLVFGIIGFRRACHGYGYKGLATSALVLGIVAIIFGIIGQVIVQKSVDRLNRDVHQIEQQFPGSTR